MNKKGFTLVEVIAVVAILALLAVIAVPNVVKLFNSGKKDTMTIQENQVLDAAKLYIEDYCRNPIDKSKLSYCNENKHSLFLFGDVNDDSLVDVLDLVKFRKHIDESSSINPELIERTDLNLDGTVDNEDYEVLRKYLVDLNDSYPERVYVCLSTIKEKGYLKDDVLYAGSKDCNGFIAFTKVNRTYSDGKTFLYCGNDEYSTIDYKNSNYKKYKAAMEKCGSTISSGN